MNEARGEKLDLAMRYDKCHMRHAACGMAAWHFGPQLVKYCSYSVARSQYSTVVATSGACNIEIRNGKHSALKI